MTADLPAALRAAVDRELDGVSRKAMAERAAKLSGHYRAGGTSAQAIADAADALAYALSRLPATYAACAAVFAAARRAAPGFAPSSLLDAGAGPAGASWAAIEAWPRLAAVSLLDSSRAFLNLARRLAAEGPAPMQAAQVRLDDLAAAAAFAPADLVVASYALAEAPPERFSSIIAGLWSASGGLLALVEPGTPDGFARIRAARTMLIADGATVLAPCPHDEGCPLAEPDWCHFAQRLPRSRDHRLVKAAQAPFEDEKFAYLLAARPGVAVEPRAARILAPPRAGKPGVELKLCTPRGLETRFVPRRDKAAHARVRRLGWGDSLQGPG